MHLYRKSRLNKAALFLIRRHNIFEIVFEIAAILPQYRFLGVLQLTPYREKPYAPGIGAEGPARPYHTNAKRSRTAGLRSARRSGYSSQ